MSFPPPEIMLAIAVVIFFAIGLHEYAHCKFADMAGDPTPGIYGRVTLKLWKHFEPTGTLMMVISSLFGVGIGWGRPAPINPAKMRNPRWDTFAAVAAGPISNLLQALLYAIALRVALGAHAVNLDQVFAAVDREHTTVLAALLTLGVFLNISLALFNLIPLGPLDGHWLVAAFLPEKAAYYWNTWHRRYGGQILIGVVLFSQITRTPILSRLTFPIILRLFSLFTGIPVYA